MRPKAPVRPCGVFGVLPTNKKAIYGRHGPSVTRRRAIVRNATNRKRKASRVVVREVSAQLRNNQQPFFGGRCEGCVLVCVWRGEMKMKSGLYILGERSDPTALRKAKAPTPLSSLGCSAYAILHNSCVRLL